VKKLIKIFAIWLIAVAIPVQGFAATAMMNCEQSASHHSQNVASGHHHNQISEHGLASEHTHDSANSSDHGSNITEKSKHSCAHCSKCTTNCSGVILVANSTNLFHQLNADEARFTYSTSLFKGFISSGLERPPRFTLI